MRILFTVCAFIVLSCSKSAENLPAGLQYFPKVDLLEKGLVFKYYYHKGKIKAHPKTDIVYRKMLLKDNIITNEDYDAGFQKVYEYENEIIGSKWITLSEKSISYRNSSTELYKEYPFVFEGNVHTDWEGNDALVEKKVIDTGNGNRVVNRQIESRDSLANGKRIRVIRSQRSYFSIINNEEKEAGEFNVLNRYEEGLGMTQSTISDEEFKYELMLDEVMTLEEFERRADHGTHRVAYIDTLMTIDDHTLFQPCFYSAKINDYYNDKRAGFKGGKGRLWAILKEKIDPKKIEGESGYLTFRFVVNCNGEAGWFVTEEAGLDYQKRLFSEACRMHLYEILKAEKEWTNLIIGTEARDAYTYITFKIKNGEIIELLP